MNRNNILAAIAALASAAIVGCMSLDDRLASTDPRVKNEAEHELIQISRATGTESDRIAAINRISNRDFLYEIAMKATTNQWVAEDASFDPSGYDGFQKSGSQGTYYSNMRTYYKTTAYGPIYKSVHGKLLDTTKEGVAAFDRLALDISKTDDYKKLFELIRKAESPYVRLAVLKSVKDPKWSQTMAKELARATSDPAIQAEAFARIEPPEARFAAMAQYAVDAKTRKDAFAKLTDQKTIDEVILKTSDKTFLLDGMAKVSDKAALASRVFSKDFIGDKDVTGKFISDYADEAMLVKIVNEHGEELSPDQCATIKAKSNNAELQNAIAKLSDKKLLPEILEIEKQYRKGFKTEGKYKEALESIIRKFSQLQSHDIRRQYLTDVLSKEIQCREDREFAEALARAVKPDELVPLFKSSDKKVRGQIVLETAPENVPGLLVQALEDGIPWDEISRFAWCRSKNVEPGLMSRVLNALPATIYWHDLKSFCEMAKDATLDEESLLKFRPKFKKPMPNPFNTPAQEFADNHTLARRCVQTISQKLTVDAKKRLCSSAREKAEAQKGKAVVFGPFYLGMPYIEALLLQEEIWGAGSGIQIWSNLKGKYGKKELEADHGGEFAMSEIPYVWKISFDNKAKFKFIDCKDSLVLAQFIYQFVEEKSGNVSSDIRYADDIRIETGKDNDMRIYEAYSNTKKGIKVQYCKKDGVLNMVEL